MDLEAEMSHSKSQEEQDLERIKKLYQNGTVLEKAFFYTVLMKFWFLVEVLLEKASVKWVVNSSNATKSNPDKVIKVYNAMCYLATITWPEAPPSKLPVEKDRGWGKQYVNRVIEESKLTLPHDNPRNGLHPDDLAKKAEIGKVMGAAREMAERPSEVNIFTPKPASTLKPEPSIRPTTSPVSTKEPSAPVTPVPAHVPSKQELRSRATSYKAATTETLDELVKVIPTLHTRQVELIRLMLMTREREDRKARDQVRADRLIGHNFEGCDQPEMAEINFLCKALRLRRNKSKETCTFTERTLAALSHFGFDVDSRLEV